MNVIISIIKNHIRKVLILGLIFLIGLAVVWHQTALEKAYSLGVSTTETRLEAEHLKAITLVQEKYDAEVQALLEEHQEEIELAQDAINDYWKNYTKSVIKDLKSKHLEELIATEIKNDAEVITDRLNPDTVRLLNEARGQVTSGNRETRSNTTEGSDG